MQDKLFDMTGKVTVVTGGAGNLGKAMTRALLEYGANVAVLGRNDRLGDDFRSWREKGALAFIACDSYTFVALTFSSGIL